MKNVVSNILKYFNDKVTLISVLIFSFLFSMASVLTLILDFPYGTLSKGDKVYLYYGIRFFLTWIAVFIFVFTLIILFNSKSVKSLAYKKPFQKLKTKQFFILNFFVIFLFWFIYFIVFFPGTLTKDGFDIIQNPIETGIQHPIVFNLFLSGIYYIGSMLFGAEVGGIALYSVIQMIIMDFCISLCITYFYKRRTPRFFLIITICYNALLPIIANYAINSLKDSMFGTSLMMFTLLIYELIYGNGNFFDKKYGVIVFILINISICFLRNNGVYIVCAMCAVLFFVLKNYRKLLIVSLIVILIISSIPNFVLSEFCGKKHLIRETLGVPLQQVGMLIRIEKIDEEDKKLLNNIMPLEEWKENYNKLNVDTVKLNDSFDDDFFQNNWFEFIKIWFKYLPRNFDTYVNAYLNQTYGFWCVGVDSSTHKIFFGIFGCENKYSILPDNIQESLENFYKSITNIKLGSGDCFWLSLILGILFISKKNYKCLLIFLPTAFCWGTVMLATPVAFGFRYVFYYVLCIPLFLLILFNEMKSPENSV